MDLKTDLIHYPAGSVPSSAKPVNQFIKLERKGARIKKKVVTNKLGQKREIWVKEA